MSVFRTVTPGWRPVRLEIYGRTEEGLVAVPDPSPATTAPGVTRFELAPPRRFILPAILLLLSERPGYGYGLVPDLEDFLLGHADRPAIYRALAQLQGDGLVESSATANPT